jgi:hypothetical protein
MKHSVLIPAIGTAAAATVLAVAPAAHAGEFVTKDKWRNCDTFEAAIGVRATFREPANLFGKGRFMVKKWIEWEKYDAGRWLERDRSYTETVWVDVTNPRYNFVTTARDRTGWGAIYHSQWRAKVTFKLMKNRPGPKDKVVDTVQIFPMKDSFAEKGSYCHHLLPPPGQAPPSTGAAPRTRSSTPFRSFR